MNSEWLNCRPLQLQRAISPLNPPLLDQELTWNWVQSPCMLVASVSEFVSYNLTAPVFLHMMKLGT